MLRGSLRTVAAASSSVSTCCLVVNSPSAVTRGHPFIVAVRLRCMGGFFFYWEYGNAWTWFLFMEGPWFYIINAETNFFYWQKQLYFFFFHLWARNSVICLIVVAEIQPWPPWLAKTARDSMNLSPDNRQRHVQVHLGILYTLNNRVLRDAGAEKAATC